MYSIHDYIHHGIAFVNNVVRRQHKELTSLMIYSTISCQSRCKHCAIWKKPIGNARDPLYIAACYQTR